MAETKEKKGFNAALYAVVAGIVVAVALVLSQYLLSQQDIQAFLTKR